MPKRMSTKKIAIDKAYATIVAAVAIAAFITAFSLVASKALLDQRAYQSKVIGTKKIALNTLEGNLIAADQLTASYQEFTGATTNVLGGNPKGDADKDGDNARIVLDALPSKYDFPALTSSVDKLLRGNGFPPVSITGTDNETVYSEGGSNAADSSSVPGGQTTEQLVSTGAIEMPFSVEVEASGKKGKTLLNLFERSIRPISILRLEVKGNENKLKFSIDAVTYFQPEREVNVRTEVIQK